GSIFQVTDRSSDPATVETKATVWPALRFVLAGLTVTPTAPEINCTALTIALPAVPGEKETVTLPPCGVTPNSLSRARERTPASEKTSKFLSTADPLTRTLNLRCPAAVELKSANLSRRL